MTEHNWEELFVVRDCSRGSGRPEPVYAGLDRCRNCRALRSTVTRPYWYISPQWPNTLEPVCKEASA